MLLDKPRRQRLFLLTDLPSAGDRGPSLLGALEHQARAVVKAARDGDREVAVLLRTHRLASGSDEEILAAELPFERACALVAREHRFNDWADVTAMGHTRIDPHFEAAVDAIARGEIRALESLLTKQPYLARAHSAYPHRSTLLHHVSANGIESTLQQRSPANARDIARALLGAGSDPDATCNVYGGGNTSTPLCLLVSSGTPAVAGVQADVVDELCKGGARLDGLDDDGAPLWTAILFGYRRCVERLAACGARVDNIVFAAALGDLDAVKRWVASGPDARAAPLSAQRTAAQGGHALSADRLREYALIYACAHGRLDVVEFLLSNDLDLTVKEPMWGSTALGMARHYLAPPDWRLAEGQSANSNRDILAMLEQHAAGSGAH